MQEHCIEEWRDVVRFEGLYQVSNLGRVKSLAKVIYLRDGRWGNGTIARHVPERILERSKKDKKRYFNFTLVDCNHRKYYAAAHVLVLEAFVGPRPEGYEGCHNDGDYQNNRLDNLRWDTVTANKHDMIAHGTIYEGEGHHKAKMTRQQVLEAREFYATGSYKQTDIARMFCVTKVSMNRALRGVTWKRA